MSKCIVFLALIVSLLQSPGLRTIEKVVDIPMKENESLTDVKVRAMNEARRAIVEEANGISVSAQTILENSQIVFDLVRATSEGLIVNSAVVESRAVSEGDTIKYRVRLRAQVTIPREIHPDPDFKVKISADRPVLIPGDELRLTIRTTKDAYIHVFNVFGNGSVTALLPNMYHQDNLLRANTELHFPSDEERTSRRVRLVASLPKNQIDASEQVVVIATKKKVDLIGADFRQALMMNFEAHDTGLVDRLALKLFELNGDEWVQDVATYRIVAK